MSNYKCRDSVAIHFGINIFSPLFKAAFNLILVCLAGSALSFKSEARDLSLAIIPEDEAAVVAADLLTAELSSAPNIQLLERAELQRIVAEQRLSLALSKDLLQAGKLAGADALLFLDHFTRAGGKGEGEGEKPSEFLGLRLILVKEGVLLENIDYPWPPAEISEWSTSTAKYLKPSFSRANLAEAAGVKLSLLSLSSPTDSRETRLLDQELNALLLKRLARETNIFVLERQKLGATLLERELNSETSPFWRGSYLIDGTVNKLGYSTNQVTLEGRVVAPGAQQTNVIQLAGKPNELPALIDRFVRDVLRLANTVPSASWDPASEAARYFDEAQWSLRWGLLPQAQSAADAAWALGKQDEATATLRVQAHGRASEPDGGLIYIYPQRRRVLFEKPPGPDKLQSGISALAIFLEWSARAPVENAGKAWLKTGLEALQSSSKLLYRYYYTAEARIGVEEDLAELRELCRDVAAWIANAPPVRDPYFLNGPELSFDELNQAFEREHLFKTMAEYGGLWQERMADALPMHRMLITAPSFALIRGVYLQELFSHPFLAGWTWNERKNALPMWRDFLTGLGKSTNVVTQIEARILQTTVAETDEKLFATVREILKLIRDNAALLGQYPVPLHYQYQLDGLLNPDGWIPDTPGRVALQQQLREAKATLLEEIDKAQRSNAELRKERRMAAALFERQKRFLTERKVDPSELSRLFPLMLHFPSEQAETVLSLFPGYTGALSNSLETAERREKGRIRVSLMQAAQIERRLNAMVGKTPQPATAPRLPEHEKTNRLAIVPTAPVNSRGTVPSGIPTHAPASARGPRGFGAQAEPFVPTPLRTNLLVIQKFHQIPSSILSMSNAVFFRNTSFLAEGEAVWLRSRFTMSRPETGYHPEPGGIIVRIDPARGVMEALSTGFELPSGFSPYAPIISDFQIWKGDFYAAGGTQLQRYDRSTKRWVSLPVPLSKNAQVFVADDRLLALNAESLLEIEQGGGSVKTLASSRRQPAITPLDTATNFSVGSIFAANGGFRVWAPPSLYQFRDGTFTKLKEFKRPGQASHDPNNFLFLERTFGREPSTAYWFSPQKDNPLPLFAQVPNANMPRHRRDAGPAREPANLIWKGLDQFGFDVENAVFLGGDIVLWGSPTVKGPTRPGQKPESIHPALELKSYLFLLSKRFDEPVVLDVAMAAGTPSIWENPKPGGFQPRLFMLAGRDHLVIGNSYRPGLWFVPIAEIAKAADAAKLTTLPKGAE